MSDRPHGYARYKLDACRCYTCAWAVACYNDAREHAMRRGTWQPWTDAEPARRHVLDLKECGIGDRGIAALAVLHRTQIHALLHGRTERGTPPPARIRPATAAKILAVDAVLDNLPDCLLIDSTGTRRRLQALVAGSWPQARLAARLGSNAYDLLHSTHVTARNARAARDLYDELWRADPAGHGVDKQAASRARNHAAARRWAPVGCWNDESIDDPAAQPDWTGHCGTLQGHNAHLADRIPPCDPCRDAKNQYRREQRALRKQHAA
jgi:hypothetical protein